MGGATRSSSCHSAAGPGLGRRVSVEVERTVDAPIERVWALLRDYRVARPRLLT
jgi:hypothetical protein